MGLLTLGKNYMYWTFSFVIAGLLVNTKSRIWRTFWSVIFVVTMIAFFLHSASTLIEYLAYEKTTVIRLFSASSAPFPAVTICNLNPFKNSAVNQSQALSNLISAYKYTLEKKTAESSISGENVRKKRAPPCDRTQQASVKAPSQPSKQNYVIEGYTCSPSSYNLTYGLCGTPGLTITLTNISTVNYNLYSQDIDKGVYLCFHDLFCNNLCNTWDSGLDALTNLTECAEANFNYPPETNGFNFMALLAEGYSSYCNLPDKECKLGLYKKKSTKYPGNYWYKDCYFGQPFGYNANQLSMKMEGCDNTTIYELDTYLLSTCTGYVKNVSDVFSDVLDETDCGTTCGKTCALTGTSNYCFYNQQNLCTFYKKCTTTGSSTTPQSTTKQTLFTISTTKQSTAALSSSISTTKSSTVKSTTSSSFTSTVIPTSTSTTIRSTSIQNPSTDVLTTKTTNLESTTFSTTEFTETPSSSTTTEKNNAEQTTTTTKLSSENSTPLDQQTSDTSSTSSYPTTTFSDTFPSTLISTENSSPPSDSSSHITTTQSLISTSTASSSQSSAASSSQSSKSITQSTQLSTITTSSSPNSSSKKSPKPITLPAISTLNTQRTMEGPNLSTTTKPFKTTSHAQISTSKSSTQSSSTKASSSVSATANQASSTLNNGTSTKTLSTLSSTSASDLYTIPSEKTISSTQTVQRSTATTSSSPSPAATNDKNDLTTILPRTTKMITTTEFQNENEIPLTSPTSSMPLITNSKSEKPTNPDFTDTVKATTDSKTKTFEKTTNVPNDNSENDKTNMFTSDFTTSLHSKTTSLFATSTNGSQIISSTLKINTSPTSITVSPSTNTVLFSSTFNPVVSTSTVLSTTTTSTQQITKKTTTKLPTPSLSTSKQEQSSTVKVTKTNALTTSKSIKTTTVKPKTTSLSSSTKTITKSTTPNISKTTTTTKGTSSSSNADTTEKLTTKKTIPTTKIYSATTSSSIFTNPLLNFSSTTTSTQKTTSTAATSSPTSKFLNQTITTTSSKADPTTSVSTTSITSVTTTKIATSTKPTQQITTQFTTPKNYLTTTSSIKELENLSKSYKLNSSQSSITIETNAQQALITIAASLSEAEKEALGYKIGDLIQTCIIDGEPCNIERDFTQTYDVDYGYCYTFNYNGLYNTTQSGSNHGLKMVVLSDINEYIATSSEQGIKVVVHYQEESPFPNVDGYRSATGKQIDLRVTYGLVSRLDAPYGVCNSLDKLKKLNQPFYFNGTYTVEGCYRSCFQQKISTACNCSDPRFPLPTDLSTTFCKISDTKKYECYEKYIEDNGDYYNVEDCSCAISCDETTFNSAIYYSNWPYGTFFYQALCTNATLMNGTDCQKYYRHNGVLVQVSYARLGYETIEEEPVNTAFDLFNDLAGNTGLWIGFSAVTIAEIALIFAQIGLWICTPWELKEVPSCRQRNYPEPEEDSENNTEETDSAAAVIGAGSVVGAISGSSPFYSNLFKGDMDKPRHLFEPKSFPNDLRRRHPGAMITDPSSVFEPIKPVIQVDEYDSQLINPTPVHSAVNESITEL